VIIGGADDPNQPVHAVLIVDNSLSMGYQRLNGTLLDEARQRLNEFLERLPPGSRISVLPLCESSQPMTRDAHRTITDAREALARIELVDARGTFSAAVDLAKEACAAETELPAKRVVFIGDQQRINWPAGGLDEELKALPDLQIVQIALDDKPANAWITDFRVQDDIADVDTPAVFTATIRYDGPSSRKDVEIALSIDGASVAAQTVDLEPGQSRFIRFAHEFELPVEPGEPVFVAASVALAPDQLPADDVRHLMVPVVASLPVMFIDQYGAAGEDPQKDRYGETFLLRRLLAPISSRADTGRQLISIRHATADRVERQFLEDCRLVVVAGIESPAGLTPLLREYIEQGGRVVIAAGGNFDPVAWTNAAWLDGAGILPLPLRPEPVGRLPDEAAGKIEPFFLSPETISDDDLRIEDASREELDDLFRTPLFFKAVAADGSSNVLDALERSDGERHNEMRKRREAARRQNAEKSAAAMGNAAQPPAEEAKAHGPGMNSEEPEWLLWARDQAESGLDDSPEKVAARQKPRILASFSNGVPFLVERRIGRGEVGFVSSGLYTGWNNLMRTNAVLVLDRLLRGELSRTLPRRNFETQDHAVFPIDPADRQNEFSLERPDGNPESLFVDAVGADRYAITLRHLTQRGHYRLAADRPAESAPRIGAESLARPVDGVRRAPSNRAWQIDLAVNGPTEESELQTITEEDLRGRLAGAPVRWVNRGEAIGLEGAAVRGQEFWKWLMAAALACLVLELTVLAMSHLSTRATPANSETAAQRA
jgi:hypothetical protein